MSEADEAIARHFIAEALRNPNNRAILQRLPALGLPDAWLVAGCLFQTVWNLRAGRSPEAGIRDYDLFYFDPDDLSEAGEQAVAARIADRMGDLGVPIEAKNQARVHLWYADYFKAPYAASRRAQDGIDRFLVAGTSVGLQPRGDALALYAPFGLAALYDGLLAPNPLCDHRALFERKSADYQARWPFLETVAQPAERPVQAPVRTFPWPI